MARNIHDRFTKEWMKQLLPDFGRVEIESQIMGEIRTIDVVFHPDPAALHSLSDLGLLGRILVKPCALEAFRNAVPAWEICNCGYKRFVLENDLLGVAKSKKQPLPRRDCPDLWIITPTFSKILRKRAGADPDPDWGPGIYARSDIDRTKILVIHELPQTPDTMLLRLLGKGEIQVQAVKELAELPRDHPYRAQTLKHISILHINLKLRQNKTKDIKEVIMNLSPAYEKWHQETLAEGEARGEAKGVTLGERKAAIAIAKKMLREGMATDLITKITGCSPTEIEQLGL
jgi:hypothetical protein